MTARRRGLLRLQRAIQLATDPRVPEARRKKHARWAACLAEKLGEIRRPRECVCGSRARLERHHFDYSRPTCVAFLCPRCHARADAEMKAAGTRTLEDEHAA